MLSLVCTFSLTVLVLKSTIQSRQLQCGEQSFCLHQKIPDFDGFVSNSEGRGSTLLRQRAELNGGFLHFESVLSTV